LGIAGLDAAICQIVRWHCVDLHAEVARRIEVTVDERTIGKWLCKLRLTRLQPRPYHPKKDPASEEAFKKRQLFVDRRLGRHGHQPAGGDLVPG